MGTMSTAEAARERAGKALPFHYSAAAVGLAAVLTAPGRNEASWASSCLPIIGGRSVSQVGPVAWPLGDPVLRFDLARTEVTGRQTDEDGQEFTTTVRKTVMGLNILNRLFGSFDVTLTWIYHRAEKDTVDVTRGPIYPYSGINIYGVEESSIRRLHRIKFNQDLYQRATADFGSLLVQNKRAAVRGDQYDPRIYDTLAQFPDSDNNPKRARASADDGNPGRVSVRDLGTVYFGEWWAEPYRQHLTYLRVELHRAEDRLNPRSQFDGDIVIDDCVNGR